MNAVSTLEREVVGALGSAAHDVGTFALRAGPLGANALTVLSFTGTEAISQLFSFQVVCWCDIEPAALTRMLLGQPATFMMQVRDGAPRVVQGIVASVEAQGIARSDHRRQYRIRVVPRLWLLKKRTNSRIFQNMTPVQIVSEVLGQAGVAYRWNLAQKYPARGYCVQYRETDYHFVKRLLAEEGIFFHFEAPSNAPDALDHFGAPLAAVVGAATEMLSPSETVVFSDSADCYPAIQGDSAEGRLGTLVGTTANALANGSSGISSAVAETVQAVTAPVVPFRSPETMNAAAEAVYALAARERVTSRSTHLRDYDFKHPALSLNAKATLRPSALSTDPLASPGSLRRGLMGAAAETAMGVLRDSLEVYNHHGQYEEPEVQREFARCQLEQLHSRRDIARGKSNCRRLFPAGRFRLDGHVEFDREYVVTKVTHEGLIPEYYGEQARALKTYRNHFECVPATVAYRPAPAKADLQQVLESAVVVGPANEEIHTDEYGRIKVQFHWDREGGWNEHSSCWIRVAQQWAGAGWGFQFIPRVGMEVLVSFIGGDEDRPMVVGCVYNGTHPVPHTLPARKTRSGIRTQSSPGGNGFNEIAFEDAADQEQIYVRAQRDLDEVIMRDHTLRVDRDEALHVRRDQRQTIDRDQRELIGGNRTDTVKRDWTTEVEGHRRETVKGNLDLRVVHDLVTHVEGRKDLHVEDQIRVEAGGDVMTQVKGHLVTVVGRHDAKRSALLHVEGSNELSSTGTTEIRADAGIVIRCGESSIRISPKSIELASPTVLVRGTTVLTAAEKVKTKATTSVVISSDKVGLEGSNASLALTQTATLAAPHVALASNAALLDDQIDDAKPIPPTTFEAHDQEGKPIAGQPFVLVMPDRSERSGALDHGGLSEMELEESGNIVFPELQRATPGQMKPFPIRQGDYLSQLAARYAFDAQQVWSAPENAGLRSKRKHRNVLLPGDIVFIPQPVPRKLGWTAGTHNTFRIDVPRIKVELALRDGNKRSEAIASEAYRVEGLPSAIDGTTDGDGRVSFEVPIHVRSVRLSVPTRHLVLPVLVGDLDPVEDISGVRARLEHLGFYHPNDTGTRESSEVRDRRAIANFQKSRTLRVTGEIDAETRSALENAHGS